MLKRIVFTLILVALLLGASGPGVALAQDEPADWSKYVFPRVIASRNIDPAKAQVIRTGPYTINIPAGAFTSAVRFEVLSGRPETFAAKAPKGEVPLLAFAFRVTDSKTGKHVARFAKLAAFTATHNKIARDSKYYNIWLDGSYRINPTGLRVKPGELRHPMAVAAEGRVITVPAPGYASWPYVEPVVRVFQRGRVATFVTWIQNNSSEDLISLEIKAKIPEGARVIKTWAGNPESNRAVSDGMSMGWISTDVPAGKLQGPFVMQVDTGGKALRSNVWLRFKAGTFGGEAVSETVWVPRMMASGR